MRIRWIVVGALTFGLLLPGAAPADWLVMRDGARLETRGEWEVKGNQVVFTLPNGTLSAVRKSEVDLDASAVLTAEAQRADEAPAAPPPPPPPPRPSVLTLTNADIPQASSATATLGGDEDPAMASSAPPTSGTARVDQPLLVIETWESAENDQADGLEITGTLRNAGQRVATALTLRLTVYDEGGSELQQAQAFLRANGLAAGKSTAFRAVLPGIRAFAGEPVFDIKSEGVTIGGPATPATENEAPAADGG